MLRTTLYSTKYKSSSDSEEQMNVVHLNIVINIAYGKFSMKVYDIIVQEGLGSKILGLGGKSAARQFATKAEELAFQTAKDKLSTEMLRQIRSGNITDAVSIDNPWQYVSKDLSGTQWASDRSWMEDMMSAAVKDANEKFSQLTANLGTTAKNSTTTNTAAAVEKSGSSGLWNVAMKGLIAYGLFSNVKYVLTDPKAGYFPTMQVLTEKLQSKSITAEEFEQLHEKQLRLAAGRLVWMAAPFALGTVVKVLAWLPVRALNILSKRFSGWIAGGVNNVASAVSPGPTVYALYINFLNSDYARQLITTIVLARTIADSAGSSPFIVGAASTLLFANNLIITSATAVANTTEKLLEVALDEVEKQTGSTVPNALKSAGLSKTPATSTPNTNKPPVTQPVAGPATAPAAPAETGAFNPADWKQTKSGFYQNIKTQELMSRQDFQRKSQ